MRRGQRGCGGGRRCAVLRDAIGADLRFAATGEQQASGERTPKWTKAWPGNHGTHFLWEPIRATSTVPKRPPTRSASLVVVRSILAGRAGRRTSRKRDHVRKTA